MPISTCAVTGNVKNLLNSNVQNCTVKASVLTPFFHGSTWISGEIASTTTDSSGNFSLSVIETETIGRKISFTFEYNDGTGSTKRRVYTVIVPDETTVTLSDLVTTDSSPITANTFPASSVTVVATGNLAADDVQEALQELQGDIDTINTLANGKIYVGNASNAATEVTPSGDVTMTNAGVTAIEAGVIVNADVNAAAAIDHSKLANITAGSVLLGNASNVPTATALSGDMTVNSSGVTAIGAGVIVNADINASADIAHSKMAALTADRVMLTDGSGKASASSVSNTTLGYLDATSSIQTQLDAKTLKSTLTTKGDLYVATAASTPARQSVGSDGQVLTADSAQSTGVRWSTPSSAPDQSYELSNLSLACSVGSSALTIAVKDKGGSDASASSTVKIGFRNATAATGTYNQRTVSGTLSLVVSSGSTLGHASGADQYIYVYALDNSGTVELAVSSALFDDGSIVTTTAEGGAGAADSNRTIYSSTARTGVPVRLIGRLKSNQTTAGTWAAVPTEISLAPFLMQAIHARYSSDAGQAIANASATIVNFEDKSKDTTNSVTVGASWKFTAPESRPYAVAAGVLIGSLGGWDAGEEAALSLYVNGAEVIVLCDYNTQVGHNRAVGLSGAASIWLEAGDYIDIRCYQASGGSLNLVSQARFNYVTITGL
jgi:hypothetical protein